jgi:glycosyltransferase involved in cell wall biosynthesis
MKPRLLFISHVDPSSPNSGQQQRVFYSAKAARVFFHTTLLTLGTGKSEGVSLLIDLFDDVIFLPPTRFNFFQKIYYALSYIIFHLKSGLKLSNYVLSELVFTKDNIETITRDKYFDCVILEYWHAYKSLSFFQDQGVPCILDMHDVQWKSLEQQLKRKKYPTIYKRRITSLYKKNEELAWKSFDRIIAINQIEQRIVKSIVSEGIVVDFLPMGIDINKWKYLWNKFDHSPFRIGFYGGLSSDANVKSALYCLEKILPLIWIKKPNVEFWLIGSNPAPILIKRSKADSRVKVTGFVENVQEIIAQIQVILCPWEGVFGFRSRVIEVMAVGTPLVVSRDAIDGMGITDNAIIIGKTNSEFADLTLELLENNTLSQHISKNSRRLVEQCYSFDKTYLSYFNDLAKYIHRKSYE